MIDPDVLDRLAAGHHVRAPGSSTGLGVAFWPGVDEAIDRRGRITRQARPVTVNLTGPLIGSLMTADPDVLRAEALRLLEAADDLAGYQAALPPARYTLTMEDTTA